MGGGNAGKRECGRRRERYTGDTVTGIPTSNAPRPDAPALPAACARCGAETGRMPAAARFCPRCGNPFGPVPVAPRPVEPVDESVWAELASAWLHFRGASAQDSEQPSPHSLMLLGYANAMYKLGFRYETGAGAARNPREAVRCYSKSARLGNPWALARLAPREVHPPVDPPAPQT